MDIAQLAQMVNWLDEEHRRDRGEIARLQQRLESQSGDIIEQARRIQELEAQLGPAMWVHWHNTRRPRSKNRAKWGDLPLFAQMGGGRS